MLNSATSLRRAAVLTVGLALVAVIVAAVFAPTRTGGDPLAECMDAVDAYSARTGWTPEHGARDWCVRKVTGR